MKRVKILLPVLVAMGIVGALAFAAANVDFSKEQNGMLRHVVNFSFKDDATPEQIQKVVDADRKSVV